MKPQHPNELTARLRSFGYALEGWRTVVQSERNAQIHAVVTIIIVALAIWLQVSRIEWAILVLTIMAIWMGEMLNTAIEAVVDMTAPDPHPLAKVAKDVAAGAVLAGAVGAVIIGLLILGPPLWIKVTALF